MIRSESDGWGKCKNADSSIVNWNWWSLESGTGPNGATPNKGEMVASNETGGCCGCCCCTLRWLLEFWMTLELKP